MKSKKIRIIVVFLSIITTLVLLTSNKSLASSDIVVALDPGHGGTESGAVGGNLVEKELTWKLASRVKEILDSTPGITGVLTKSKDETLNREIRARRAKDNDADLLVSFHINSNDASSNLSGAEVYITHNTKQRRYYEYSNILGLDILENLRNVGVPSFSYRPKTRVGTPDDIYPDGTIADYYGIISWPMHLDIPAVLIEHCFINNPSDRANYLNDTMLYKMAEADAKAIIENKELFRRDYYGEINTDLQTMSLSKNTDGRTMISGNILIAEWVDGVANEPQDLPKMTLKSTDGTYSQEMYVRHESGLNYYYDRVIDNLDMNKEYYIEVELTSTKNISDKKKQQANMKKLDVGTFNDKIVMLRNNRLIFSDGEYKGDINTDLKTIELKQTTQGKYELNGEILIVEYIDGVANTPKKLPEMMLKSEDGTILAKFNLKNESGINYTYNANIDNLDITKEYYIEAQLTSSDNISNNKTQTVKLPNKELGNYNGRILMLEANKIKFVYKGEINTDLTTLKIDINKVSREYIKGNIVIAEWINGVAYEPEGLPKMTLKSTDGQYSQEMYVRHDGGLNYYYDRVIYNLDTTKEYYIEVELTGKNNISDKKKQIANIRKQEDIGELNNKQMIVENNILKFQASSDSYIGEINTDLTTLKIDINEAGREYIKGNIIIAEWINGIACKPQGLPKMTLKSTDGTYSQEMYVRHEGGLNYYYDRVIYNLDTAKEYYIEVELTGENNISDKKIQIANIRPQRNIGKLNNKEMIVENNKLRFQGNEYIGEINTDLTTLKIDINEASREYIKGNIIIAEWINGVAYEPQGLPKMTLKSTDGTYSQEMYVRHDGGLNYYYDRVIYNLDTTKEYYIEVELTGENNISDKKVQIANIRPLENIGKLNNKEMIVENNQLKFKEEIIKETKKDELQIEKIEINEKQENKIQESEESKIVNKADEQKNEQEDKLNNETNQDSNSSLDENQEKQEKQEDENIKQNEVTIEQDNKNHENIQVLN